MPSGVYVRTAWHIEQIKKAQLTRKPRQPRPEIKLDPEQEIVPGLKRVHAPEFIRTVRTVREQWCRERGLKILNAAFVVWVKRRAA